MRLALVGTAERARYLQDHASPGVTVDARPPLGGPETIESMVDEYAYIPGVLDVVRASEAEGFDAVITGCFGDPGIDAARELVRIPVLAPGETSMVVAAMLGHSFSIVTVLDSVVRPLKKLAQNVGVAGKLASVRVIGVPVMAVRTERERVYPLAVAACRRVVEEDDADVIVMGCGSMSFYAAELSAEVGVPVINPLLTSLRAAEMLIGSGLTHSKRAYPVPPKIAGYAARA
ncbi:MAG TPA: aspartate/glutamate racemase family protein [Bacillota bacterium]|nr:aspartate/glutamate racemase family protein [Bacillota bacterium]